MKDIKIIERIALLTILIVCSLTYFPGLSGGFYFDDYPNIIQNKAIHIDTLTVDSLADAMQSGNAGPLKRPIAMLSFAVNHRIWGMDSAYFKLVNLAIHLMVGLGLFLLSKRLFSLTSGRQCSTQHKVAAYLVMALWLFHPINLSPVLYVVQRMASLSALFVVIALLSYLGAHIALKKQEFKRAGVLIFLSFFVCFPLALFSKENAILFWVYLLLLEIFVLRTVMVGENIQLVKRCLFSLSCLVLIASLVYLFVVDPDFLVRKYQYRSFSIEERASTQPSVMLFYLRLVFLPSLGSFGLHHDGFETIKHFNFVTTSALATIFLILFIALKTRVKAPLFGFGVTLFFASHLIESTIYPLEMVHEHRNYLGSFGLLLSFVACLMSLRSALPGKFKVITVVAGVLVLSYFISLTFLRSLTWGDDATHVMLQSINHPKSPRSQYAVGRLYVKIASSETGETKERYLSRAEAHFMKSSELDHGYNDGLFGLLLMELSEGVDMQPKHYARLLDNLATKAYRWNNYNYFNSVLNCIEDGYCERDLPKIHALYKAGRLNPRFRGSHSKRLVDRIRSLFPEVKQ